MLQRPGTVSCAATYMLYLTTLLPHSVCRTLDAWSHKRRIVRSRILWDIRIDWNVPWSYLGSDWNWFCTQKIFTNLKWTQLILRIGSIYVLLCLVKLQMVVSSPTDLCSWFACRTKTVAQSRTTAYVSLCFDTKTTPI